MARFRSWASYLWAWIERRAQEGNHDERDEDEYPEDQAPWYQPYYPSPDFE